MNKRPLQITTAVLGLIPLATGMISMLGIDDPLYASAGLPRSPVLDSNMRFFGGLWAGLGIATLWLVPSIERRGVLFRTIWGAIFLGGIGQAAVDHVRGRAPGPFVGFTVLEIVGAPLFIYWQHRVAQG